MSEEVKKPLMKFRLKRGKHRQGGITYERGAIVESHIDLVKRMGGEKFEKLDGSIVLDKPEVVEVDDGLEAMTVPELRKWAAEEEIDLTGLNRKEEILTKIRDAFKPG